MQDVASFRQQPVRQCNIEPVPPVADPRHDQTRTVFVRDRGQERDVAFDQFETDPLARSLRVPRPAADRRRIRFIDVALQSPARAMLRVRAAQVRLGRNNGSARIVLILRRFGPAETAVLHRLSIV